MERFMEFLNLPGVLPAMIGLIVAFGGIMGAMGLWIRYDGKRRLQETEIRWQIALKEAEAKAESATKEAERKADQAKAELQEGQTIAETLRLLVKLQEQSMNQQIANQEHNRAEREEARKANIEALDRITDTFSSRHGQLAGNLAANTEAMVLMSSKVDANTLSMKTDLAALTQAVTDLANGLKANKRCEDEVKPLLAEIKSQLATIQERVSEPTPVIIEVPPPDIQPATDDPSVQDVPAA